MLATLVVAPCSVVNISVALQLSVVPVFPDVAVKTTTLDSVTSASCNLIVSPGAASMLGFYRILDVQIFHFVTGFSPIVCLCMFIPDTRTICLSAAINGNEVV